MQLRSQLDLRRQCCGNAPIEANHSVAKEVQKNGSLVLSKNGLHSFGTLIIIITENVTSHRLLITVRKEIIRLITVNSLTDI